MIIPDSRAIGKAPPPPAPKEKPKEVNELQGVRESIAALEREVQALRAQVERPSPLPAPEVNVHIPAKPVRWLFKINRNPEGEIAEIEARVVE